MLPVGLVEAEAKRYIAAVDKTNDHVLSVACVNSPKNVTVSGHNSLLSALKQTLDNDGVFARKLTVPNAYHSQLMEPIAHEYHRLIGKLRAGVDSGSASPTPAFYSPLQARQSAPAS